MPCIRVVLHVLYGSFHVVQSLQIQLLYINSENSNLLKINFANFTGEYDFDVKSKLEDVLAAVILCYLQSKLLGFFV